MTDKPIVAVLAADADALARAGLRSVASNRAYVSPGIAGILKAALKKARIRREKPRVEEAVRRPAFEWKSTFDAISDAVCLLDGEGKITRCNVAMRDLLGKPWKEIIGRSCCEWVHNGSGPLNDCPAVRMRETGRRESLTFAKGDQWFEVRVDPLRDEAGQLVGAVHILFDVTEDKRGEEALRASEATYRTLVENLPQRVFLKDGNGVYVSGNENYARDLGIGSEELAGKTDYDFYPRDLAEKYQADDRRIMESGTVEELEERYLLQGEERIVQTIKTPLKNEAGQTAGILGIFSDITEHRRLEEQLRQSLKMEAIGQLAGGVAHDFNNILQAVLGYVQLNLKKSSPGEQIHDDLREIQALAERGAALTRQLLIFSRRQALQPENLDLNQVIGGVLKMLRRVIGENVELEFSADPGPQTVYVDRGQIEQVLMNLCLNARDAMPEGGRIVIETKTVLHDRDYCRVHPWAQEGWRVALSVSDTGVGMSREVQERIFEPFFTTKEHGQGTGLGLATVYGIVKQHNGEIRVYSEPGQGATFRIYLPATSQPARQSVAESKASVEGGDEAILLAEDEELVRAVVCRVLEEAGYTVLSASDGQEAVNLFEAEKDRIDLALLDAVMPKLNGVEACRRIRAIKPGIRVLFSSGYSAQVIGPDLVRREGADLIVKPYDPDDLLRKVRGILDRESKPA